MIIYNVLSFISWIIWLYCLLIVIDAIMSWLPFLANSALGRLLDKIVDPYLNLFRKGPIAKLAYSTGIDLSAVIGIFLLYFIQDYALSWIANILYKMVG
ncbi:MULTISPECIES: YggT family protein [Lactobacillus]|uniref:YggT family protein n=1 Tax=Lactobacillus xujianguonis TaxID=2495899 RepID=A0A437STQ1_9LACO|nr:MULTISPECIES: YggT family protein [Lactobacillus]RVU70300.1 YggT family protein [Lactobacillus xujianguonis]RVU73884.1 YggT family protein [Lactobacillus xujianguonis]